MKIKKLDNFSRSLEILRNADFSKASEDNIYRTGIVGQFSLTFELAWKSLQAVMRLHSVMEADIGSPRDILKLGYKIGFIEDSDVWLLMLKKRNLSVHIYDEEEIDELIVLIRDSFVPALSKLEDTLYDKLSDVDKDSWD